MTCPRTPTIQTGGGQPLYVDQQSPIRTKHHTNNTSLRSVPVVMMLGSKRYAAAWLAQCQINMLPKHVIIGTVCVGSLLKGNFQRHKKVNPRLQTINQIWH